MRIVFVLMRRACVRARHASESPVPEVLEQFVFDFRFTAEGAGSMGVSTSNRAGRSVQLTDSDAASVTGLKKQACAMVRLRACCVRGLLLCCKWRAHAGTRSALHRNRCASSSRAWPR